MNFYVFCLQSRNRMHKINDYWNDRTNEHTSKFVRNKFSVLFSNFSTNCSMLPKPNQQKKKKKTKPNRFILCGALTTCSISASPHSRDFNYTSFGLNLFTGVNYFLKRFSLFFFGNEKTINHCANEVQLHLVRVWATLTSIFLMPFLLIFFLSFFFFFVL